MSLVEKCVETRRELTGMAFLSTFDRQILRYHREVKRYNTMPSLRELRLQAGMTAFELAVASDVSISTINRLETGKAVVSRLKAYKVIKALSEKLERDLKIEDIEGIQVERSRH